jgi:hypothetical protein
MSSDPGLRHTINPLASYSELPNACFRDQEKGERVELLLRRHPFTNTHWIAATIIGLLIPMTLHILNPGQWPGFEPLSSVPTSTIFLAEMLWLIVVVGFALENFLIWYYNVYLVTNMRLVDVDFVGLLQYSSTEAELKQIQDVEHKQTGLWQLLFNFGTVEVQTAGIRQNIDFHKIPKPYRVADIITDLLPEEAEYSRIKQEKRAITEEQVAG